MSLEHPTPSNDPPAPDEHPIHEPGFEEGTEAAPPGVRAMSLVRWAMLLITVLAAFASVSAYVQSSLGQGAATHAKASLYRCPMHPQVTADRPGECPICHMSLELVPEDQQAPASSASAVASASAAPSASAQVKQKELGSKVIPAASGSVDAPLPPPPDTAPLTLTLDRIQAIGVRTARVELERAPGSLRLNAVIEVPEQGRAEVHARTPGFIESIAVKDTGVKVRAGEVLATIYSPEIFQAEQELIAMGAWVTPGAAPADVARVPLSAARKKLELLGLGKDTIDRIVATGKAVRAVGVTSPISGYITRKNVVLGSYAMPDKALFEIADLGRVYVIASVYPHLLAQLHVGAEATFRTPSLPERSFITRVDLIYPDIDLQSRTARARLQIKDPELALRPGQFGTIELAGDATPVLTIPMDAVVDTGRAIYVFLAEDGGHFTAKSVVLGERSGDRFVVRSGLVEGQRVVSGATFLIDAESRLKASVIEAPSARGGTSHDR